MFRGLRFEVLLSSPFCGFEASSSFGHPSSSVVKVAHPSIKMSVPDKVERPNTLVVSVPEELSSESHAVIGDKLISSLGVDAVRSIQFVKHFICVTFSSFDAHNRAFLSGIFVGSTCPFAVEADPILKDVYLEHLPFEVSDDAVRKALGCFGAVNEIVHLKHAGTPVYNGTRLLQMSLASDVPVNVRILRYPCRVFYSCQPRPSLICRSSHHRAFDCPLGDVCRRCRMPGHFACDCPEVVNVPAPPGRMKMVMSMFLLPLGRVMMMMSMFLLSHAG